MRIWSLHPKYLDAKGLVALWRETLLAKKVLEGRTKGYKNHPQLNRFKQAKLPLDAINKYLEGIYAEAVNRQYEFDRSKFEMTTSKIKLTVTQGQLEYEFEHLKKKLAVRDASKLAELSKLKIIEVHPLFSVIPGGIEEWEII